MGLILLCDLLWLLAALGLSHELRYMKVRSDPATSYYLLTGAAFAVWTVLFRIMRLDGFDGGCRLTAMAGRIAMATLLLMLSVLTIAYFDQSYYSRLVLVYFCLLLPVGFMLIRLGVYWFFRTQHQLGITRRIVLVGDNQATRDPAASGTAVRGGGCSASGWR
jgi:CoA-binding domain